MRLADPPDVLHPVEPEKKKALSLGSTRFRRRLNLWLTIIGFGAVIGYFYVALVYKPASPEMGTNWQGVRAGVMVSAITAGFEIFVIAGSAGAWLRRLPFLGLLAIRAIVHTLLIIAVLRLNIWIGQERGEGWALHALNVPGFLSDTAFSFVTMTLMLFVFQMRSLIGGRTLRNFILGRYHRPTSETRIFMVVDLVGSTPIAETLGNERFHGFLSQFFFDIDAPVVENSGEVLSYVGDAMIASWPLGDAPNRARALACVPEILAVLEARADTYRRRFGVAPQARLALHVGAVVAGECGDSRRQITYLGDTLNAVSRMEGVAKSMQVAAIASAEVVAGLAPPRGMRILDLGPQVLTGLADPVPMVELRQG